MNWRVAGFLLTSAFSFSAFAQMQPGMPPRNLPSDYAATFQTKNATYAASLLPADQVKHIFAVDISKTYVVFEVACYPAQNGKVGIGPDDFLVKSGGNSEFIHSADAVTVASVIQEKNTPRPPSGRDVAVVPSATVGYETGTDPYSGRRVHGVYTEAGVGVGANPGPDPRFPPPPGSSPYDRQVLQAQLAQRALPWGQFTTPIAGYLYFPASRLKKNSNGTYELNYLADSSARVQLQIPTKGR
ncbi:MAG: hypothetical protein JO097_02910 [Acidobacteriaceae bacterium]|nr:hypothetical protein [Acidobacteriaceae bacterium]